MTDAEILATGELCAALLISHQFKDVVSQYEQTIASDIIATKQDEQKRREELYSSLWGTRGLLEFMVLQADAAAAIKAEKPPTDVTKEYATTEYAFDHEEQYDAEGFSVTKDDY